VHDKVNEKARENNGSRYLQKQEKLERNGRKKE
jgi:hypothetical protein